MAQNINTAPGVSQNQQSSHDGKINLMNYVRAISIIQIIFYHYFLEKFHGSFLITPNGIAENLSRLEVFKLDGVWNFFKNLFAWASVYGFSGVNVFVFISGFAIALSQFKSDEEFSFRQFIKKRFVRILIPLYTSIMIGIVFLYARNFFFENLAWPPVFNWIDILKLFFVPFLFYSFEVLQKFNGDLWFIILIFQFYLFFPVFVYLFRKIKPLYVLVAVVLFSFIYRFIAYKYLGSVPMGVIYPAPNSYYLFSNLASRLAEFILGMYLAVYYLKNPGVIEKFFGIKTFFSGILIGALGFILNMYPAGFAFSDFALCVGLIMFFGSFANFIAKISVMEKLLNYVNTVSYELYLTHHYYLNYLLIPVLITFGLTSDLWFFAFMPIFFIGSLLVAQLNLKLDTLMAKLF